MSDDDDTATMGPADSPPRSPRRPAGRAGGTGPRDAGRPVSGGAGPSKSHKKRPAAGVDIAASMTVTYRMLGQFWAMKDPYCGPVLMGQAEAIGAAWETWADQNPRVRKVLEQFAVGGGALPVVLAHLPLVLAVIQHHTPQGQAAMYAQAEQAAAAAGMTLEDFVAAEQAQQAAA